MTFNLIPFHNQFPVKSHDAANPMIDSTQNFYEKARTYNIHACFFCLSMKSENKNCSILMQDVIGNSAVAQMFYTSSQFSNKLTYSLTDRH
jgi:hypothetical protein